MLTRRRFVQAITPMPLMLRVHGTFQRQPKIKLRGESALKESWFMPEEGEPHECTWMSFGPSQKIWGRKLIGEVRQNLATVAESIARFEPVVMCVRPKQLNMAKKYFSNLKNIDFFECPLDDMWIRDFGAVYVVNDNGEKAAVDFNFNGWGEKQHHENDSQVAAMMAKESEVHRIQSELCLEGGGIEVDGHGTAIITESCVLIDNRNPDWTKQQCEEELLANLGIEKVIWLPGVRGADITDGHTDFYARFAKQGVVIAHLDPDKSSSENALTKKHLEILESETDAQGNRLKVILIDAPKTVRPRFENEDFCAGYINFYVCNGAVLCPEFGDKKADGIAKEKITEVFPKREIVMLNIDGIAAGGGGIHCATQQEPKV